MKYVTFLASSERWTLFEGVGLKGSLLGERARPPKLIDFSMTLNAMLWIASGGGENSSLQRVKLPELSTAQAVEAEGRLTALAAAPDGQKVVALRVPRAPRQRPSLVIWNGHDWLDLNDDIV